MVAFKHAREHRGRLNKVKKKKKKKKREEKEEEEKEGRKRRRRRRFSVSIRTFMDDSDNLRKMRKAA